MGQLTTANMLPRLRSLPPSVSCSFVIGMPTWCMTNVMCHDGVYLVCLEHDQSARFCWCNAILLTSRRLDAKEHDIPYFSINSTWVFCRDLCVGLAVVNVGRVPTCAVSDLYGS